MAIGLGCFNDEGVLSKTFFPTGDLNVEMYNCAHCADRSEKSFKFSIIHANRRFDLKRYGIIILLNGKVIYDGIYSESIVTTIPFCLDNHLEEIFTLSFIAVDTSNGICYMWSKKQSYYLLSFQEAGIKLQSESYGNGYKIRFDDALWYD